MPQENFCIPFPIPNVNHFPIVCCFMISEVVYFPFAFSNEERIGEHGRNSESELAFSHRRQKERMISSSDGEMSNGSVPSSVQQIEDRELEHSNFRSFFFSFFFFSFSSLFFILQNLSYLILYISVKFQAKLHLN